MWGQPILAVYSTSASEWPLFLPANYWAIALTDWTDCGLRRGSCFLRPLLGGRLGESRFTSCSEATASPCWCLTFCLALKLHIVLGEYISTPQWACPVILATTLQPPTH